MRVLSILLSCLLLSACASSALVTGTPRAPIDPSQVRIYHSPPPGGYEEIALLRTHSGALTYGTREEIQRLRPRSRPLNQFRFGRQNINTKVNLMVPRDAPLERLDVTASMDTREQPVTVRIAVMDKTINQSK